MNKQTDDEVKRPSKMKYAAIAAIVIIVIVAGVSVAVFDHPKKVDTVTFYTWWATEGKVAVDKEYAAFHAAYPNLTAVSELKAGAGGSAAKGEILTLIRDGDPPESFQSHYGPGMLSYVEAASNHAKAFVNMTSTVHSMKNVIPEVLQAGEYNGVSFSLPVDMHRGAELYINPNLLYNNSISKLPTNLTALMKDSSILNTALAGTGGGWTIPGGDGGWDQMQVWEDFFLANSINVTGNATLYDELMYGTLNMSNATSMKVITDTNNDYLTAFGERMPGIATLTWTAVIHDITGSKSGFQANGNWYVNYAYDYLNVSAYSMNSKTINTSYDHTHNINLIAMPFPGTEGYFALIDDSIAIPVGSNQVNGLTFAKFFSSFAGNQVFAKWKASSFYNNITSPTAYNTPSQWGDYTCALDESGNSSRWVYQLSDGGLFAAQDSSFESDLESLTSASSVSTWNSHLSSVISSEQSSWMAGHNLSLGFMGTLSHPFGGYLPPWAHDSVTPSVLTAHTTVSSSQLQSKTTTIGFFMPFAGIVILVVAMTSIFIADTVQRKR